MKHTLSVFLFLCTISLTAQGPGGGGGLGDGGQDVITANINYPTGEGGCSDGSISINILGGIEPFSFLWKKDNVVMQDEIGPHLLSLIAGDYSVTVTDANCNIASTNFILDCELFDDFDLKLRNCKNGENGAAVVGNIIINGTSHPLQSIKWYKNGIPIGPSGIGHSIFSLTKGDDYAVVVTDAYGHSVGKSFEIYCCGDPQDQLFMEDPIVVPSTSTCTSNGSIIFENGLDGLSGSGVSPFHSFYEINWSNGSEELNLIDVPSGEYTLKIRNTYNGWCDYEFHYIVGQGDNFNIENQFEIEVPGIDCLNDKLTGNFNIALRSDSNIPEPSRICIEFPFHLITPLLCENSSSLILDVDGSTTNIWGPENNEWSITFYWDEDSCLPINEYTIKVPAPKEIEQFVNFDVNHAQCSGLGSLQFLPYNGNEFEMFVNGFSLASSSSPFYLENLQEGYYFIELKETDLESGNTCSNGKWVEIIREDCNLSLYNATIKLDYTCVGDDLYDITMEPENTNTNGLFLFRWSNGEITQNLENVPPGHYIVEVTKRSYTYDGYPEIVYDLNGNPIYDPYYHSSVRSFSITIPQLTIDVEVTPEVICEDEVVLGQIIIRNGSYTSKSFIPEPDNIHIDHVSWDRPSGDYTIKVIDDYSGCQKDFNVHVSQSDLDVQLIEKINIYSAITCEELGTLEVFGGIGASYSWSNGMTGPRITRLEDGAYTVTVTNGDCAEIKTYTICTCGLGFCNTPLPATCDWLNDFEVHGAVTNETASGSNDGSIILNEVAHNFNLSWEKVIDNQNVKINSSNLIGVSSGVYRLTISDGCFIRNMEFYVGLDSQEDCELENLNFTTSIPCNNNKVILKFSHVIDHLIVVTSNGLSQSIENTNIGTVYLLGDASNILEIIDPNTGCSMSTTVIMGNQVAQQSVSITARVVSNCYYGNSNSGAIWQHGGMQTGVLAADVTGLSPSYITWFDASNNVIGNGKVISGITEGLYRVEMIDGCGNIAEDEIYMSCNCEVPTIYQSRGCFDNCDFFDDLFASCSKLRVQENSLTSGMNCTIYWPDNDENITEIVNGEIVSGPDDVKGIKGNNKVIITTPDGCRIERNIYFNEPQTGCWSEDIFNSDGELIGTKVIEFENECFDYLNYSTPELHPFYREYDLHFLMEDPENICEGIRVVKRQCVEDGSHADWITIGHDDAFNDSPNVPETVDANVSPCQTPITCNVPTQEEGHTFLAHICLEDICPDVSEMSINKVGLNSSLSFELNGFSSLFTVISIEIIEGDENDASTGDYDPFYFENNLGISVHVNSKKDIVLEDVNFDSGKKYFVALKVRLPSGKICELFQGPITYDKNCSDLVGLEILRAPEGPFSEYDPSSISFSVNGNPGDAYKILEMKLYSRSLYDPYASFTLLYESDDSSLGKFVVGDTKTFDGFDGLFTSEKEWIAEFVVEIAPGLTCVITDSWEDYYYDPPGVNNDPCDDSEVSITIDDDDTITKFVQKDSTIIVDSISRIDYTTITKSVVLTDIQEEVVYVKRTRSGELFTISSVGNSLIFRSYDSRNDVVWEQTINERTYYQFVRSNDESDELSFIITDISNTKYYVVGYRNHEITQQTISGSFPKGTVYTWLSDLSYVEISYGQKTIIDFSSNRQIDFGKGFTDVKIKKTKYGYVLVGNVMPGYVYETTTNTSSHEVIGIYELDEAFAIKRFSVLPVATAVRLNSTYYDQKEAIIYSYTEQINIIGDNGEELQDSCNFVSEFILQEGIDGSDLTIGETLGRSGSYNNEIVLYPNPFSNKLTVELPHTNLEGAMLNVYANDGQKVMEVVLDKKSSPTQTLDMGDMYNGVYTIMILIPDHEVITKKIIKL